MSTSYNKSIQDLQQLQRDITFVNDHMKREVQYEDAAIFIGTTKSGKSTLINYLIGNKLMGEEVIELLGEVSIKKGDNSPGPSIGNKSTSETIYPTKWKSRLAHALTIWDAPGFDDNRGIVQDITNAFYVYELFQNLKSAKIVLVTDINDIVQHNTRPFVTLLNAVEDMLKEKIETCSDGIAIIFTKVPQKIFQAPNYKEKIMEQYLENKFLLSGIDISPGAKNFISRKIHDARNIGFFKQVPPNAVNQYITDTNINEGIFEAIQNTKGINEQILKQVSPSISERSKIFLHEVREQLCSSRAFMELQGLLRTILNQTIFDFEKMNMKEASQENILQLSQKLESFKAKLVKATDSKIRFADKIDTVRDIDPSIKKLIDENILLQAAKLMKFIDMLLGLQESNQLDFKLQDILIEALSYINEVIINMKLKLNEITVAEADAQSSKLVQQLKEERKKLRSDIEEARKNNADMTEKIHLQLEKMMTSQTEKDKEFFKNFEELKRMQEAKRQQEKQEMQRAAERLLELQREAEIREQERERRAEMREQRRREDEERSARQRERDEQERKDWKRTVEEKERKDKKDEKDKRRKKKEEKSQEKQNDSSGIEISVKIPNPVDILRDILK